ncbi:MAG: hypothetical protein J0L72_04200 [Armatimonadetes bacterium]|nr:hypothetical protein [Armatimonadota bacterium]
MLLWFSFRLVTSVLIEEPAPFDRQLVATLEESSMGATTNYTYSVNLKRLDTGSRRLVFQCDGCFVSGETKLRWDNNMLVIYNLSSETEYVKLNVTEIHGKVIYVQYMKE